jgi:hypothetical protein
VAPVLDPTWQNPYAPSTSERHHNQRVVRRFAFKRRLPQTLVVGAVALALIAGVVVVPWLPALGVLVALVYAWDLRRVIASYSRHGQSLGESLLGQFSLGGDAAERVRLVTVLDRLAATFGVDGVSAFIVSDPGYNAALVPSGNSFSLLVTSALIQDFELIELEGVVAHCLARQRLGLLDRESLAAVISLSDDQRQTLAGVGKTYRADEVAAASIRYPLGLAGALRRCARQSLGEDSFFGSSTYAQRRWVFFNQWSDRREGDLGDLDDVELRARALEEW